MCTDIYTSAKKMQESGPVPLGLSFTHCPRMHLMMFLSTLLSQLKLGCLTDKAGDVPTAVDKARFCSPL